MTEAIKEAPTKQDIKPSVPATPKVAPLFENTPGKVEVSIRRIERSKNVLDTRFIQNSTKILASVFKNGGSLNPFSLAVDKDKEKEKALLTAMLTIDPNHVDFRAKADKFWQNLRYKIDVDGLIFDITVINNFPVNVSDYIGYEFAKKHPLVAKNKEEGEANGVYEFYVYNPEEARLTESKKIQAKMQAYEEFNKIVASVDKEEILNRVILLLANESPYRMVFEDKFQKVHKLVEEKPQAFVKTVQDKNLEQKYFVASCLQKGVLKKVGDLIMYDEKGLGTTLADAAAYIHSAQNTELFLSLRERLSSKAQMMV